MTSLTHHIMCPPVSSRRRFLSTAAGIAAGAAAIAAAPAVALSTPRNDSALLALEEQIFAAQERATEHDEEIYRLWLVWRDEFERLSLEREAGRLGLTSEEILNQVGEMPECKEHSRLARLTEPHQDEVSKLLEKMWAIPAKTPEGRRAKLLVLLNCVMQDCWRDHDEAADWDVKCARNLLIEFVGGEPGEQLRDQFRTKEQLGRQDWQPGVFG